MFVEILSNEMISAGKALTEQLDKELEVSASLWIYEPDSNTWRLVIASPRVKNYGPKMLYKKIQSVISTMPEDKKISLKDIALVDKDNRLILLLRKAVRTEKAISGIRFSRNTINGSFIEDAYIYRLT